MIAVAGEVFASTSTSKERFETDGLTLRLDGEQSAQAVLVPPTFDRAALLAAGLTAAGTDFFVDRRVTERTALAVGIGADQRGRSGDASGVVLYGTPTE